MVSYLSCTRIHSENHFSNFNYSSLLISKTGGRGFIQQLWPNCNEYRISQVETYTANSPVNSTTEIRYDSQEFYHDTWYRKDYDNTDLSSSCVKYEGYLNPPYSGMFKLFARADDRVKLYFGNDSSDAVSMLWYFIIFILSLKLYWSRIYL